MGNGTTYTGNADSRVIYDPTHGLELLDNSQEDMAARPYGCRSGSGQHGAAPATMGEAMHHAQEAL